MFPPKVHARLHSKWQANFPNEQCFTKKGNTIPPFRVYILCKDRHAHIDQIKAEVRETWVYVNYSSWSQRVFTSLSNLRRDEAGLMLQLGYALDACVHGCLYWTPGFAVYLYLSLFKHILVIFIIDLPKYFFDERCPVSDSGIVIIVRLLFAKRRLHRKL